MLTSHRAVIAALTTVPRMGSQMCRTNITALTSRMKVDRTEMATLKEVNLSPLLAPNSQRIEFEVHTFVTTRKESWVSACSLRMRIISAADSS